MYDALYERKSSQYVSSERQIRRGIEDNSKVIFLFLNENICCDPSFERSHPNSSNEGSQHVVSLCHYNIVSLIRTISMRQF